MYEAKDGERYSLFVSLGMIKGAGAIVHWFLDQRLGIKLGRREGG